jgi:hypothetical protein
MPEPLTAQTDDAVAVLQQVDAAARAELALDCPAFSPETALWAARLVYHLCQFTVCRDIDEKRIQEICNLPCPEPRSPEVDWSVDQTLRHLPRIFHLARQLSSADPLVHQMRAIAIAWPLSSVGFPRLEGFQIEPFINHPALRRLYADRIMATSDDSRLGNARLDDTLRADLSIHHELSPALARKLFPDTHDTH